MSLDQLTSFLGWSTVVNSLLMLWALIAMTLMRGLVYKIQGMFVKHMSEIEIEKAMYNFLGCFKLAIIFLNFTPWLVIKFLL